MRGCALIADPDPSAATRQAPSPASCAVVLRGPGFAWQSSVKVFSLRARMREFLLLGRNHLQKPHSIGPIERHQGLLWIVSNSPCFGNLQLPQLSPIESRHAGE